jgi:hypothetical protein
MNQSRLSTSGRRQTLLCGPPFEIPRTSRLFFLSNRGAGVVGQAERGDFGYLLGPTVATVLAPDLEGRSGAVRQRPAFAAPPKRTTSGLWRPTGGPPLWAASTELDTWPFGADQGYPWESAALRPMDG